MVRPNVITGRGTPTEKRYYAFLTGLPCCLSGRTDAVQRAHTGPKFMGRKSALWTVFPLQHVLHLAEEANRLDFWTFALPGQDHLAWAERLFGNFEERDRIEAEYTLAEMADLADRAYLEPILRRAA